MKDNLNLDTMLAWTRHLYDLGPKRPGTYEGALAEEYLHGILSGMGLPRVSLEPVHFTGWFHERAYLEAHGRAGCVSMPAEPVVYTSFTPASGICAPIVNLGSGSAEDFKKADLSGKIALVYYSHGFLEYETLRSVGYFLHDPDRSLEGKGQVMSWVTEEERRVYQAAVDGGAVGFIGVFPLDITPYLCFEGGNAFTGRLGSIPGLGLRKSDGARLRDLLDRGGAEGTLILTGSTRGAVTRNAVGVIPGKSERVVQVTCHHDSMWLGATEDAAGVAIVLALAEECRRRYDGKKPPLTLAFVLEGAECLFVLGSRGYIERHKDGLVRDLVVDLHIEHLAKEYVESETGALVPTGQVQARGLFVTDRGPLIEIVKEAVVRHDLRRTILLPTNTPLAVPTDASAYNKADLPVASFISPPLYWNALEDTWEKIAVDQMLPTARAYLEIIEKLMETDPDSIRKAAPPGDGYLKV